ncbi:BON domain-containing protein [Ramlibacter sp. AN1015]|uniref:BON domain-containing protein n=1 Tax=Ramlibacter sp. AN1015 TaxID=3133428 RepID=UPI0030BDBD08
MKQLVSVSLVVLGLAGLAGCANTGGGSQPQADRTIGQAVDDVAIVTRMKAALAADPDLAATKINVDSQRGAVRLKGEVKNMALRRKAEDLARRMDGVRSVDNQLIITG